MSYLALYRKWRPQDFNELVGQDHISRTLKNAISTSRFSHAYLLCGPRGTGKTTTAKIIAKAVNCLNPIDGNPCNKCESCTIINSGNSLDALEIDAASNRGIDEIRDLREKVNLAPAQGKYKVYIIDEVHMLTNEAFNALLKTLEEPPGYVVFVLATTEPHKLPATILSRCQRFDFRRIDPEIIVERLEDICVQSNISYEKDGLIIIARLAQGGMRDALGLMDQCLSYGNREITVNQIYETLGIIANEYLSKTIDFLVSKDVKQLLDQLNMIVTQGKDIRQFANQLLDYLRDLLIYKTCGEVSFIQSAEDKKEFFNRHEGITTKELNYAIEFINQAEQEMRWSGNGRLLLEMAFFKYMFKEESSVDDLVQKVQFLEGEINKLKTNRPMPVTKLDSFQERYNKRVAEVKVSKAKEEDVPPLEEQPSKEASSREQARSSSLNLSTIKSSWDKVLDIVKKNKITTHAFLVEGKVIDLNDDILTISFASNHSFHKEKIEQIENTQIIEEVLQYLFKTKLKIKCIMESEQENAKQNDSSADLVEVAARIFGGKVIEIKD